MAPIRNVRPGKRTDPLSNDRTREHCAPLSGPLIPQLHRLPSPELLEFPTDPRPKPLTLNDLECVRTLGEGVYGKVLLVRVRRKRNRHPMDKPSTLFAMKVFKKRDIRRNDRKNPKEKDFERKQLCTLPWNPFVNSIVSTFFDTKSLYLMLELIPCGNLHAAIQKRGPFDNATAAFYYANIVCALDFLQSHNIVHRDLKPDNILMGPDGYLCLADFGWATKEDDDDVDWLLVGTPAYMAPELISPQPCGYGVDWWASGIILFEMTCRKLPFFGVDQTSTFKRTMAGICKWPKNLRVGKKLKDIVSRLLTFEVDKRLGALGVAEVVEHPWLGNVDWGKMNSKQYRAPYIPKVPKLTETWLDKPLPDQAQLPGLHIVLPPIHRQFDDRFPKKRTTTTS